MVTLRSYICLFFENPRSLFQTVHNSFDKHQYSGFNSAYNTTAIYMIWLVLGLLLSLGSHLKGFQRRLHFLSKLPSTTEANSTQAGAAG
jgi:hypothetical protein